MLKSVIQIVCSAACLMCLVLACSKDAGPPPPLAAEQIPAELQNAFKTAKQEAKDLAAKVSASLQAKDYPSAYDAIQALANIPDISLDQRKLTTRAMLTIYGLLQAAQAQGDDNASAALRYHQRTK